METNEKFEYRELVIPTSMLSSNIDKINSEDIIALTFAEGGACGYSGEIAMVAYSQNELNAYVTNFLYEDNAINNVSKLLTWFSNCRFSWAGVSKAPKGWQAGNLGLGNYILVKDKFYEPLKEMCRNMKQFEIYDNWDKLLIEIVKKFD